MELNDLMYKNINFVSLEPNEADPLKLVNIFNIIFDFRLYKHQRDYLFNSNLGINFTSLGRATGKSLIQMFKLITTSKRIELTVTTNLRKGVSAYYFVDVLNRLMDNDLPVPDIFILNDNGSHKLELYKKFYVIIPIDIDSLSILTKKDNDNPLTVFSDKNDIYFENININNTTLNYSELNLFTINEIKGINPLLLHFKVDKDLISNSPFMSIQLETIRLQQFG